MNSRFLALLQDIVKMHEDHAQKSSADDPYNGMGYDAGIGTSPEERGFIQNATGEISGAYGAQRGIANVLSGIGRGSPVQVGAGAVETGLSVLPYSNALSKAAFATAPRSMATMFGYGALPVMRDGIAGEANAAEASQPQGGASQALPLSGPATNEYLLRQYSTDRARIAGDLAQARRERDVNASKPGPIYRAAVSKIAELEGQVTGLDKRIERLQFEGSPEYKLKIEKDKLQADADQAQRQNETPYRVKSPLAPYLPAIGLSLAAGVPFFGKALGRALYPGLGSRMAEEVAAGSNALAHNDPAQMALSRETLNARIQTSEAPVGFNGANIWNGAKEPLALGVAGGGVAAEASMFPDQYDAVMLPDGPAKDRAREAALNPYNYVERGAMGALTANSGAKLGTLVTPQRAPDYDAARGVVRAIDGRATAAANEANVAQAATGAADARAAQFTAEERAALNQAYARAAQDQVAGAPNLPPRVITPQKGTVAPPPLNPGPNPPAGGRNPPRPNVVPPANGPAQRSPPYSEADSTTARDALATRIEGGASLADDQVVRGLIPLRTGLDGREKAALDWLRDQEARGVPITRQLIENMPNSIGKATLLSAIAAAGVANQQPSPQNALGRY